MQEVLRRIAFELAQEVSEFNVLYVILFGSVAKGKATRESDLDFFIVLDTDKSPSKFEDTEKIRDVAIRIERKYNRDIQVVFTNKEFHGVDKYFVQKALSEGIVLYAKSPKVQVHDLSLEPYTFIACDLSKLPQSSKMRLRNQLYGYETKKRYKNKVYRTKKPGLLDELNGRRLGIATFMIPKRNLTAVERLLDSFEVDYKEIDAWVYS
ncbi:MAG TPA: nucleotidyltransferase domain-containing protein [Thermodesulfobacteriota bacterium]|nr:nucleotidyltransferase domain-containing protein [Thermodesulfobacteriota bacterium]